MNVESLLNFNSLAEAQSHTITNQRMISPDMLLAMLTKYADISFLDNPTTQLQRAITKAFQFGSEFNLMEGHSANQIEMLDAMVAEGTVDETFKAVAMSYANHTEYPFGSATQEQWDEAQLMVNVPKIETTYLSGEFITALANDKYALQVTVENPLEFEDKLTITASSKNLVDGAVFAESFAIRGTVSIPANYTGTILTNPVNLSGLSRHVKIFTQSKYNRALTSQAISVL